MPYCLVLININGLAAMFGYLLDIMSYILSVLIVLSAKIFKFLSAILSCFYQHNKFVSYSIFYQVFLLILDNPIEYISTFKSLLNYLFNPILSRLSYLYRASRIFHYIIQIYLQAIKFEAKTMYFYLLLLL